MRRAARVALACLIVTTALPVLFPPPPAAALGQVTPYMTGLNIPIALAFSPDGRIFFNERNTGNIRIIEGGLLVGTPFYTLANTDFSGERGLLGLALDPGFPASPWVYAYQTYDEPPSGGTIYNRIVRIQASGNVGISMQVLLPMPPLSGATNHNGGVIGFGPDGMLYAVVGENANIALAQNMLSPMGKVLRMNPDGSAPTDNPFYGNASANELIYTYGHRNMFGLAFHPFTGRAYVTENGPSCNDEVNLLVPGGNFAWGTSQTCTEPPPPPQNTNRDGPLPRQMPLWYWTPTICPTNAAIYVGPGFPGWQGDMIMGDCNTRRLHRLDLVGPAYDGIASDTTLYTAPSFIMDVELGPDGAIWFTTPTTIYRYWDSGRPPVASFTATPNPVTVGTPVAFDASASSDPDGAIVSYAWDFGDSQIGIGVTTSHMYAGVGSYVVALTVTDNETFTNRTTRTVVVQTGPIPPQASFTAIPNPAAPGMAITFDASASSDPDGAIVSYEWDFGDGNRTAGGVTMSHAYAAVGTYVAELLVTDDDSLTNRTTQTITIQNPPLPPTASFTASPNPALPGAPVTFDASASSDPDGTIVSYAWDFGDTATGTGMTASHAYAASGRYTATLTVTDNATLTGNASREVVVNVPPTADFSVTPPSAYPTVPVAFDASASSDPDGTIVAYAWTFGDGASATGVSLAHTYTRHGDMTVVLTVTDDMSATGTASRVVPLGNRPPRIMGSSPSEPSLGVQAGTTIPFVVIARDDDGDILTYVWRVDGFVFGGNDSAFNFAQAEAKTYTVNITVSDGFGGEDHEEWTVTVTPVSAPSPPAWWFAVPVVVIVLLVLLALWWRRRRRRPTSVP